MIPSHLEKEDFFSPSFKQLAWFWTADIKKSPGPADLLLPSPMKAYSRLDAVIVLNSIEADPPQ